MPDYGNKSYWDERYAAGEEFFDWHQNYATVSFKDLSDVSYVFMLYEEIRRYYVTY